MGEAYAHVVGQKLPNAFGLYDVSGNVYEWCEDDYHSSYTGAPTDGSAWVDSPRASTRVLRGGDWYTPGDLGDFGDFGDLDCRSYCRSALRTNFMPSWGGVPQVGFRLAR